MNYQLIRNNAAQFKALTSLTVEEFDELLPKFEAHWLHFITRFTLGGQPRTRRYSPRDSEHLSSVGEKLFFILSYQKTNSLQEFIAAAFGLTQDMSNKWIHVLSPLLQKALSEYKAARRAADIRVESGQKYAVDATERTIERPTYDQEEYYSGKKHRHSVKNLVLCTMSGIILFCGTTVTGKLHDKKLADQTLSFSKEIKALMDLGFLGYTSPGVEVILPHKKPPKKELTEAQKTYNTEHARERVIVENAFSGVKIMRIVKDTNRNRKQDYRDLVMDTAVSLHNFRCTKRNVRTHTKSICS
jgi:hypothetical protein